VVFTRLLALAALACWAGVARAAPSGAIFTTVVDGTEVNLNQYPSKEDVYLDGGPGPGAPQTAAGLDSGTYVFQVTDPSGKVLLSTDQAKCRQFVVEGGIITSVAPAALAGCAHKTGTDVDHGAMTVQLMPYDDTPNNGGVYKVWATPVADYLRGCRLQGIANGLDVVDCGPIARRSGGVAHGFIPAASKTDNFKVKYGPPHELDVTFEGPDGVYRDGLATEWFDTVGGSNVKWSVWNPRILAYHEAHVENVENGIHRFDIFDQPGCQVDWIAVDGEALPDAGPQMVTVLAKPSFKSGTIFVRVHCKE
jgi:hypothetical protein